MNNGSTEDPSRQARARSTSTATSAALRQLVDELRSAPPPALDWQRMESELLRRTQLEATARRRAANRGSFDSVVVFAAVAAAVVMLIAGVAAHDIAPTTKTAARPIDLRSLPTASQEADALPLYRIDGVAPHSVVSSDAEPSRFTLPGVATWTLAPHSSAVVETTTVPHVIKLEKGSVVAEVIPRPSSDELVEAFVVEAGSTRVAVHGTIFSVALVDDRVTVEVMRGSVTVGPTSYRGATTGHLLVSPARAAFAADTAQLIELLPPSDEAAAFEPATAEEPAPAAVASEDSPPAPALDPSPAPDADPASPSGSAQRLATHEPDAAHPPASSDRSPRDAVPSDGGPAPQPEPALLSLDEARGILVACLAGSMRRNDDSDDDTMVIISTTVSLMLGEGGKVNRVGYNPPLPPDMQQRCAGALFAHRVEGTGTVSFRVTFSSR